jgi:hypothetical protein
MDVDFESRLDAVICGVELNVVIYGIELSAMSVATCGWRARRRESWHRCV